MKKIIFFSKNLCIGGMEKALVTLLNELCNDYEITLVLEEKKGELLNKIHSNINIKEYKVSVNKNILFRKTINFIKRLKWALLYKNKYDFSCNYATYSLIGSRLAQISSLNSAFYIHSNYYDMFKGNLEKMNQFFSYHHIELFKKLIFVSNESKSKFLNIFPNYDQKSIVVNNIVDYNNILKLSQESCDLVIDKKCLNFIFIGRLDNESKNLDLLLDSFLLVLKQNVGYRLYIIGDGSYKNEMLKKAKGLEKNIIFLGEKINPYSYLIRCDALILTSNYEGFPVVYLEALVLNKPILTTVLVSDESINIKDFCIKLEYDAKKNAKILLNFKRNDSAYHLNFKKINEDKVNILKKIIDEV